LIVLHVKQVFTAAVAGSIRESQLKGEEGQEDLKESHRTAVTEVCDVIEKKNHSRSKNHETF